MKSLMCSLTQLFDMYTVKEVGNKVEFVLRRLFSKYFQLQVFQDCSSSSFSTTSRIAFSTSRTSSSASDVFRIHFEDMDEKDVLSVEHKLIFTYWSIVLHVRRTLIS